MDYRYMPFYMQGAPIAGMFYGQTQADEKDYEYMREMYPEAFERIQEMVERECEHQEFIGCRIFDEFPDKLGILRMVNRIFEEVKKDESNNSMNNDYVIETVISNNSRKRKYPEDNWLKDIIRVLLLNEIYARRKRRKKYYRF